MRKCIRHRAVQSCLIGFPCGVVVGMNATATGTGVTFSYPATTIWQDTYNDQLTCTAKSIPAPPQPCLPNSPQPPPNGQGYFYWDINTCSWQFQACSPNGCGGQSPIIIDTEGLGFSLTSAKEGVLFDFYGDGRLLQLGWPTAESKNGWLALDRNGNGQIDDARELFGNITAQPASDNPNGFLALAVYDSNGDGIIDKHDPVWPKLLVWIDANHDGISQPDELHHLDDVGIHSISLKYVESQYIDGFGNKFRYKGKLNPVKGDDIDRTIYDVFLTTR